jgi:Protein of unknown function (DUF493).
LANISKKSNEFYKRFKTQLDDSQNWPGPYMFKFIIKNNSEDLNKLKKIFSDYECNCKVKSSEKGNYKSISFEGVFESPTEIIGLYKKVSSLDNIISL